MFRKILDFVWTGMSRRERYKLKVQAVALVVFVFAALAVLRYANDLWDNEVLLGTINVVVMFAMVFCGGMVASYMTLLKFGYRPQGQSCGRVHARSMVGGSSPDLREPTALGGARGHRNLVPAKEKLVGKTVIPIGKSFGRYFDGETVRYCELDLGDTLEEVTVDELLAWERVHELASSHLNWDCNRITVKVLIQSQNKNLSDDDAARIIDRLFDMGALIEVDADNPHVKELLSTYKLVPTGRGFGNSQEYPEHYGIGHGESPEVFVGRREYVLWGFAHQDGSTWDACRELANENPKVTAEEAAAEIANVIPALVATHCAYLERLPKSDDT